VADVGATAGREQPAIKCPSSLQRKQRRFSSPLQEPTRYPFILHLLHNRALSSSFLLQTDQPILIFFHAREFEPGPDWHPNDCRSNAAFTLADINGIHVLHFRVEACQSSPEF